MQKGNENNIYQKMTQSGSITPQKVFEQIRLVESYNTQNSDPHKLLIRVSHSSNVQLKEK